MKAKFYSVGTGPGDPKLITYKAVEVIRNCDIIAVPNSGASENAVLKIVAEHIKDKEIIYCDMPMIRDKAKLEEYHQSAANLLASYLDQNKSVAFLTLGDPTIYSTTLYVHQKLQNMGYEAEIISGVPSFCAVAAKLNIPLCEGGEPLHIIPASYEDTEQAVNYNGNKVLMKSGKSIAKIKELLNEKQAQSVECCGMENEKIHKSLDTLDENSSYFNVIIVKEKK
ncbi:precorrin-2 C(20)-methyltransferase [Paludicola sp. MB14-C6]|uniref:precorrin-2 C(20)-methyltransferase n=1 Tax=Paludihabitans sp. MB14-C6 TaxID=3070656 RepID=UPI0027DD8C0E|nr:precorrin-2 C(20)-methyltransferase [Paludicola sp. MB14-C6]WMJ22031.1 precorrin-2 C(20)-methyltransferase [Paludicola sp. MB14-C6]